MVAYPDRGEGNDPEPFFFFFFFRGVGSLSQPGLNIFTVDNMGVMICLGQEGLRSLSASSFYILYQVYWTIVAGEPNFSVLREIWSSLHQPKRELESFNMSEDGSPSTQDIHLEIVPNYLSPITIGRPAIKLFGCFTKRCQLVEVVKLVFLFCKCCISSVWLEPWSTVIEDVS